MSPPDERWRDRLEQVRAHHVQFQRLPSRNQPLGRWLTQQRSLYRLGAMPADRGALLEAEDWWSADRPASPAPAADAEHQKTAGGVNPTDKRWRDEQWLDRLEQVRAHYAQHQRLPASQHQPLAKWLAQQRIVYRRGAMRADRAALLEAEDWWSADRRSPVAPAADAEQQNTAGGTGRRDERWLDRLEQVRAHYSAHQCLPGQDQSLGRWLKQQRSAYRGAVMRADRAALLEAEAWWSAGRSGRPRRPAVVITDEMIAEWQQMHDGGASLESIARQAGTSQQRVGRHIQVKFDGRRRVADAPLLAPVADAGRRLRQALAGAKAAAAQASAAGVSQRQIAKAIAVAGVDYLTVAKWLEDAAYASHQRWLTSEEGEPTPEGQTSQEPAAPAGAPGAGMLPPESDWRRDDAIMCLECGEWKRALGAHLWLKHETTSAAYRLRWGMRQRQPLTCGEVSAERSRIVIATGGAERIQAFTKGYLPVAQAVAQHRERRPQELAANSALGKRQGRIAHEKAQARITRADEVIAAGGFAGRAEWLTAHYLDAAWSVRRCAKGLDLPVSTVRQWMRDARVAARPTGPKPQGRIRTDSLPSERQ
jgi:hypothetical protein